MKNNDKYFFCYSKQLHKYLHTKMKFPYICGALHETTSKKFWLYELTDDVRQALDDYKKFFKEE